MLITALRAAKNAALRGAALSGIEKLLRDSAWRRKRLLILCYHGVSIADEHEWSNLYVTPEHLAKRLDLIRASGYTILPFGRAVAELYGGNLPPRSVAVTFDDGFADFYLRAQPILEEFETPTTLYLTTYYTTNQRPVFDPLLSYLLWKGQGRKLSLAGPVDGPLEIPRAAEPRAALHGKIRDYANRVRWSAEEKDEVASRVAEQIGFDLPALRDRRMFYLMSKEELAGLDRSLVDIQLHTHRHRTPRNEALFVDEVADNRKAIRALMPERAEPTHFCYPSGDYDLAFLPWLRKEGVVSATTCEAGIASARHDPLLLPRLIDTMHLPEYLFRSWLAGTAGLFARG